MKVKKQALLDDHNIKCHRIARMQQIILRKPHSLKGKTFHSLLLTLVCVEVAPSHFFLLTKTETCTTNMVKNPELTFYKMQKLKE